MALWHAAIALLLLAPVTAGCIGSSDPVKTASTETPTAAVADAPVVDEKAKTGPLNVSKFQGRVDGAGTPLFAINFPMSQASDDIKAKENGSLRFELKFVPNGAATSLHVEVNDMGTTDAAGQPKVLGEKNGGPFLVIDLPAAKLVGVKQLGFRVFMDSGSVGQNVEYKAAASIFNGTIPQAYTALGTA